jgi:hypothetical protein
MNAVGGAWRDTMGGRRWSLPAERPARSAGSAAVLGSRSHGATRCAHCVRSARTSVVSQITKRASTRADLEPPLLAAPQVAPTGGRPPHRAGTGWTLRKEQERVCKGAAGPRAVCVWGAEERRAFGRARTRALRPLTRRACSSAANVSERSELRGGPEDRAPQGQPKAAPVACRTRPGCAFAAPTPLGPTWT